MRIGILTSGGDCSSLNATIRAFCKHIKQSCPTATFIGFLNGYGGLISREYVTLLEKDYEGILNEGGTILGSSRQPYKLMTVSNDGEPTKLSKMVENYHKLQLDGLITLGGAGTHKSATLLSIEGCNVIGLPKTIDNDIYGTDVTFGFHTAVDIASEGIERVKTTAKSHSRTIFVEVMGNKVGWLTLYAGISSGADAIIIPEIPYDEKKLCDFIANRKQTENKSTVIAVAEGAMSKYEYSLGKKERKSYLEQLDELSVAKRLSKIVELKTGVTCRATVLGHIQRGGNPSAYDKILSSQIGSYGAKLFLEKIFGVTVSVTANRLSYNALTDIAGKAKFIPADSQVIELAKSMGVYFCD